MLKEWNWAAIAVIAPIVAGVIAIAWRICWTALRALIGEAVREALQESGVDKIKDEQSEIHGEVQAILGRWEQFAELKDSVHERLDDIKATVDDRLGDVKKMVADLCRRIDKHDDLLREFGQRITALERER